MNGLDGLSQNQKYLIALVSKPDLTVILRAIVQESANPHLRNTHNQVLTTKKGKVEKRGRGTKLNTGLLHIKRQCRRSQKISAKSKLRPWTKHRIDLNLQRENRRKVEYSQETKIRIPEEEDLG